MRRRRPVERGVPEDRVADEPVLALRGEQRLELALRSRAVEVAPDDRGEARVPVPLPRVMAGARAGVRERDAVGGAHALAPVLAKDGLAHLADPRAVAVFEHASTDPRKPRIRPMSGLLTSVKSRGARSSERSRATSEPCSLQPGDVHVRSILDPPELLALCPTPIAQQHQAQHACFAEIPRRPAMCSRVIAHHGYLWAETAFSGRKVRGSDGTR